MERSDREQMADLLADLVEGHGTSGVLEASFRSEAEEVSRGQISVLDAIVRVLRGRRDDPLVALRRVFSDEEKRRHLFAAEGYGRR